MKWAENQLCRTKRTLLGQYSAVTAVTETCGFVDKPGNRIADHMLHSANLQPASSGRQSVGTAGICVAVAYSKMVLCGSNIVAASL